MLGGLLVKLAFVSCLVSIGGYVYHLRSGNARGLTVGRIFFHGMVVTVLVTSALLLFSREYEVSQYIFWTTLILPLVRLANLGLDVICADVDESKIKGKSAALSIF